MRIFLMGWLSLSICAGDLEKVLQNYLETLPNESGMSVAILGEDLEWVWARSASDPNLNPDMAFRIASMTKTYTAATIFRLIEAGRLALQDPLDKHLTPEYLAMLRDAGYNPKGIRIDHLLTHTSGMREHPNAPEFLNKLGTKYRWTPSEQIRLAMELGPPLAMPGKQFRYSDTGFVLLGQIIEATTGQSLATVFRQLLGFDRLGLKQTWLETVEPQAGRERVHQFWGTKDTHDWHPSFDLFGGGGLVATPRDSAIFLKALLENRVLTNPENLNKMRALKLNPSLEKSGAGLYTIEADGLIGWGHQGFWNTFMFYFPDLKVTIAGGFTHKNHGDAKELLSNLVTALKP